MAKELDFKQGKLAYTVSGKGSPLVLVHGFLASSELWKKVLPVLEKQFTCICLDLPGHGRSDSFGYIHTMELLAQCIAAVAEHLKVRNISLVGHSMGGYASLAAADLYPDLVKSVILLHSTSYADNEQKKQDRDRAIKAVKASHTVFIHDTVKNLFAERSLTTHKKEVAFAEKLAEKCEKRGIINSLEGMKQREDRRELLTNKKCPVYMIHGVHDKVLNKEDIEKQAKLLGDRFAALNESGHMSMLEQPEECAKLILRFLK